MSSWRDEVLNIFEKPLSPLYIVSDPDGLLTDEVMLTKLQEKRLTVTTIQDIINFRYLFETKYRHGLKNRELFLIIRGKGNQQGSIPYDLAKLGAEYNIGLASLFPKLSYPILKQLDVTDIDALYTVYQQYQGSSSNKDTIDFLLEKVFKIHLNAIENTTDFIGFLLSYHYREKNLPGNLSSYLVEELKSIKGLGNLPITRLVHSKSSFYLYLQNEWQDYINQLRREKNVVRDPITSNSYYHTAHPFSDPDVRRLLSDLFLENKLQPIKGYSNEDLPIWVQPGIIIDKHTNQMEKFNHLLEKAHEELVNASTYKAWIEIAKLYGELSYLFHQISNKLNEDLHENYQNLSNQMNLDFEKWMTEKYSTLYNIPYYPSPVMVDKIAHYLASLKRDKIALVILDGMNFGQWSQIKQALFNHDFHVDENGVLAWVPTITSVSRQAIFSGKMPMMFSDSMHTTNKEEKLWKTFWEDKGIPKQNVSYQRALGKGTFKAENIEAITKKDIRIAGLVVDTIDELS